jgi:CubicO group peptidase (beta-lactamase class C family)
VAGVPAPGLTGDAVPGAVIGVLRDGAETITAVGLANAETGEAMTATSRFSAASLTKPMVATVIARLAQAGALSLADPVATCVPELRGRPWAEHATIRDLLANRSGLPMTTELEFGFAAWQAEDDGVLARFAATVAEAEPGRAGWSYTNAGWCLLGRAVEVASGLVFEDAMHELLLGPAGMDRAAFGGERVTGHVASPDGAVPVEPLRSRAYGPAGTTLVVTAGDLLGLAARHLDDPALDILRARQPSPRIHGWFDGWCLGWAWFDWDGGAWGWDGLIPGERAFLRLLPDRRAAVVLLTNGDRGRALARTVLPALMAGELGVDVPPLPLRPEPGAAGDLDRFAGVYAWPDRRIEVSAAPEILRITDERGITEALPIDPQTFLVDPDDPDTPCVTFGGFDAAGRPHMLYEMLWGLPRV